LITHGPILEIRIAFTLTATTSHPINSLWMGEILLGWEGRASMICRLLQVDQLMP